MKPIVRHDIADAASPVMQVPDEAVKARDPRPALCVSGGGYRAMLFHLGSLWRLNELGILPKLGRVSSVSGGSITAAVLAMKWKQLTFGADGVIAEQQFVDEIVAPIRRLASHTVDVGSVIAGALLPGVSISDRVTAAYRDHLFGDATLEALPLDSEGPRFVINATNVHSGVLWRFSRPYMADWRVGRVRKPELVSLAKAVACSSAFPPILSPATLELEPEDFDPNSGADLQQEPFTRNIVLTDGGVYDNLGLETAFKRHDMLLVSDAGAVLGAEEDPKGDWGRHGVRATLMIMSQVAAMRKKQLVDAFKRKERTGAYWGIRSDAADYPITDALTPTRERVIELASTPTRLVELEDELQDALIDWGYMMCDTAMRSHVTTDARAPRKLPYMR